ncbi:MAG TPA: G1 family glutamic endopeptidase [Verrucomicrobiae bacterium]|nr:G1 family glutamic endopeptidase [Verrucomicrobiae bacterium]
MRPSKTLLLLAVSTGLLALAEPQPLHPVPSPRFLPAVRLATKDKSRNWAGYIVATSLKKPQDHSVTDVRGTWRVPDVSSSGAVDTSSAIWVGIDGATDHTVEQIGTEQDSNFGSPAYYAWYEMYPLGGQYISTFPIAPGDQIKAEVQLVGTNLFLLTISNLTQNAGFSITEKHSAKRTSAEWIVEAPFLHRILPLADFQSVTFSDCSAAIGGSGGAINDTNRQNLAITMENFKTSTVLAQPSALTGDGTSFSVTWDHN